MRLSDLRRKYNLAPKRPKGLRFFSELTQTAQEFAVEEERGSCERFTDDDAAFLTEDFQNQLAEKGFSSVNVFWNLGYCQGDGVAFYGRVFTDDLRAKDSNAKILIERLEKAGEEISIEITGANNWYHHRNSMTLEVDFESETDEEDLPSRFKIILPVWREELESYLSEKIKEISDELEKSGYGEIDYRHSDEVIRQELNERGDLYEKVGTLVLSEFEFDQWKRLESGKTIVAIQN